MGGGGGGVELGEFGLEVGVGGNVDVGGEGGYCDDGDGGGGVVGLDK